MAYFETIKTAYTNIKGIWQLTL